MADGGKADANPFQKSSKVQRSPVRAHPHSESSRPESESDDQVRPDLPTKKRKEVSPTMPGSSRTKRTSIQGPSTAEMQVDLAEEEHQEAAVSAPEDEFAQVSELLGSVNRWFSAQYKNKKLTIHQYTDMSGRMTEAAELLTSIEKRLIRAESCLAERTDIIKMISTAPRQTGEQVMTRSYADVSRAPPVPKITGAKKVVQQPKVVFIKSKDDKQNIEEVKQLVQTTIRPKDLGIKVKKVIKTARGLLIETEKADQLDKLKNCDALKSKGLVIEAPKNENRRSVSYTHLDVYKRQK